MVVVGTDRCCDGGLRSFRHIGLSIFFITFTTFLFQLFILQYSVDYFLTTVSEMALHLEITTDEYVLYFQFGIHLNYVRMNNFILTKKEEVEF